MNCLFKNGFIPASGEVIDFATVDGTICNPMQVNPSVLNHVEDLEGRMVIRGFADLHMHLDKALACEFVENKSGTLSEAIEVMQEFKKSMSPENVLYRAEKAINMCYTNGTKIIRTHVDVDASTGINSVQVMKDIQQRYHDRIHLEIVAFPQEGIVSSADNYAALEEALKIGADLVGGIPANDISPKEHIDMVFELAKTYDVNIDMHIDETDDPDCLTIKQLAEATIFYGWQGRVTAGHLCSLSGNSPNKVKSVLRLVKDAGINLISLPSTNLYLQGRGDKTNIRRGIAPIKKCSTEFHIPTAIASDNTQDPFNPFGTGNPLQTALIAAHGCHMGGKEDLNLLFDMITKIPYEMVGIPATINVGQKADFIVLDAKSPAEAIIQQCRIYGKYHNNHLEEVKQ